MGIGREKFESLVGSGEPDPYLNFLTGIFELYEKVKNKPWWEIRVPPTGPLRVAGPQPIKECEALCEFLGGPYDDAMVCFHDGRTRTDLPNPRRKAKKAWLPITGGLRDSRTEMSTEDVERFGAAAGELLDELGYERAVPRSSAKVLGEASRSS